jgi:hypothetical protein
MYSKVFSMQSSPGMQRKFDNSAGLTPLRFIVQGFLSRKHGPARKGGDLCELDTLPLYFNSLIRSRRFSMAFEF